jgi:histone deacetylase complex regulatory component SIN3
VVERVKKLLGNNEELLEGFRVFLPPSHRDFSISPQSESLLEYYFGYPFLIFDCFLPLEILTAEVPAKSHFNSIKKDPQLSQDFSTAKDFVQRIKQTCPQHIYKTFLTLLHEYHSKSLTIMEVNQRVSDLISKDYPELYRDFQYFLPSSNTQSASNSVSSNSSSSVSYSSQFEILKEHLSVSEYENLLFISQSNPQAQNIITSAIDVYHATQEIDVLIDTLKLVFEKFCNN